VSTRGTLSLLATNDDFRRFVAGEFVTNAGDSLYAVAVLWLVYDLTGSTALTGVASAILLLPWLLQALAGPLVDRLPLRPLLVGAQFLQGVVVLGFPLAAVTGRLNVGVVFALVPVLMLASLVTAPIQATLVPRLVAERRLSGANAVLATVTLGLDMVFDALGGALVALFGTTTLFLVDAGTFALAGLLFARISTVQGGNADRSDGSTGNRSSPQLGTLVDSYLGDLQAGVDAVRGSVFVELVGLTAVTNLATGVTLAVLPAFSDSLGGPLVYGLLLGGLGVGRLVGSLIAPRLEAVPFGWVGLVGNTFGAACWLAAVVVQSPAVTVTLFGLAWVPAGASGVLTATLNQTVFPGDLLGRVSSLKGTASGGTLPLGSLTGGLFAAVLGVPTTMALAAGGFGLAALAFLLRGRLRRLPPVADATPEAFDVTLPGDAEQ
jgi:MFS family permease